MDGSSHYSYFNVEEQGYLRTGKGFRKNQVKDIDFSEKRNWAKILTDEQIQRYVDGIVQIQILIPFHNSPHLPKTIKSILESRIPKEFRMDICIVASACTSEFLASARKLVLRHNSPPYRTLRVIVQEKSGKPLALNSGLKSIDQDLVIQIVDDITIEENAIALSLLSLHIHPEYGGSVVVGIPQTISPPNLLSSVQKIHHDYFSYNDQFAFVGRMYIFRKKLIPDGFPNGTVSEDFWLALNLLEKTAGYLILDNTFLLYKNPTRWSEYLSQIDRYYKSFQQLKFQYPVLFNKYLCSIKNNLTSMITLQNGTEIQPAGFIRSIGRFLTNREYTCLTKFTYLLVVLYQLYFLKIKHIINPKTSCSYTREYSTTNPE